MHMLTKNFALDLAKDGVNVIGVHPGWLKTRMGGKERAMLSNIRTCETPSVPSSAL